jgi:putative OPT family oligopeptide transporter
MNPNPSSTGDASDASSSFKPYVAAETQMVESTIGAIVLGSILGIVFAAASVYAGLKIGLTTSASIPIGVLSITILKAFGKSTILKNNIVQTTGSAGESLAAGVAFTLPSLLLMGFEMDAVRITLIALLGGILGTLMMIPLRQSLIVKEHGKLPYPEGTACAQVLIVGERGGSSARSLFGGLLFGGLWAYLGRIGHLFAEGPEWVLSQIPWKGKLVPFFKGGSISFETNPVLMGTGFIIGWRTSFIMLAGGILSYLVLIPAVQFFGVDMTSPLVRDKVTGALIKAGEMSPGQIRNAFVLYIGAGAVAAGGLISLAKALPTILGAFLRGLSGLGGGGGAAVKRTDRDLPMSVVLIGCVVLVLAIWAPSLPFVRDLVGRDVLGINWLSAILIIVFGFFFTTVSSRITGEIGSSSNPISGMTVATLLITCVLFVAVKWTGISYKEMALCTAALVCVAASNGGATSQALKCGHLLGATPRAQQIAITWGVITSAAVIGFTMMFLNDNMTSYHKFDAKGFAASAATLEDYEKQGRGPELAIKVASTEFHGKSWDTLYVRRAQMDPADPSRVLVPVGAYLIENGAIVHRRDPGVCGTETQQLAEDGTVERKFGKKYDAPKARLFQMIIDGVLEGTLPWELVLIGVFIAIMMELCGVPALAFAVGVYLPISTSSSIFLGGLVRKLADKKSKLTEAEQESSPGVLFSSGLIAGGALVAILSCALLTPKTIEKTEKFVDDKGVEVERVVKIDKVWGDDLSIGGELIDLNLANHLFGPDETVGQALARWHLDAKPVLALCDDSSLAMNARVFMDEHNWWGLGCFLVLGLLLYIVSCRKPKQPPATAGPM